MLRWPVVDDREDFRAYARIVTHPFLQDNLPLLADLLDRSLLVHRGVYSLTRLQFDLLNAILEATDAIRIYRRYRRLVARALNSLVAEDRIERVKAAQKRLGDLQQCELAAEWLLRSLRSIGDGVAWRFLEYDRAMLRLLAEHPEVGPPQLDRGLVTEMERLVQLAKEEGRPVLLNAVTNFLRVGDLTIREADGGSVTLVEVKSGAKTTARSRRQDAHRASVQREIDSGIYEMGELRIRRVAAGKPLLTYVSSVGQAIAEAQ